MPDLNPHAEQREKQWVSVHSYIRSGSLVDCYEDIEFLPAVRGGQVTVKWPNGDITEETMLVTGSAASDYDNWDCAQLVLEVRGHRFTLRVSGTELKFLI